MEIRRGEQDRNNRQKSKLSQRKTSNWFGVQRLLKSTTRTSSTKINQLARSIDIHPSIDATCTTKALSKIKALWSTQRVNITQKQNTLIGHKKWPNAKNHI